MTVRIPRRLVVSVLAILALGGVAVAALVVGRNVGRSSINRQAIRAAAYSRGFAAGETQGRSAGEKKGRVIGAAQGRALGETEGRQIGYTNGYNAAVKKANSRIGSIYSAGTNGAFAGYNGWDVGHFYIVQIGPGTAGAKYEMPSRIEMVPGHTYNLCPDSNGVCGS